MYPSNCAPLGGIWPLPRFALLSGRPDWPGTTVTTRPAASRTGLFSRGRECLTKLTRGVQANASKYWQQDAKLSERGRPRVRDQTLGRVALVPFVRWAAVLGHPMAKADRGATE
jgi:hypothetical protein